MQGLWSLIGKIGTGAAQNFPYEIGEKAGSLADKSVWTLHEGKKKSRLSISHQRVFMWLSR